MNLRIQIARGLIRAGQFIQSLAVTVMRPADLARFSLEHYNSLSSVSGWTAESFVSNWLAEDEQILLEKIPIDKGRLLLLGIGGGREAIPLAKMGFEVTGVDFSPEILEKAMENAFRHGVKIEGFTQDIGSLDIPRETYDLVWFSRSMYSSVPARKTRIAMLGKVRGALKPQGYCLLQSRLNPGHPRQPFLDALRRLCAWITLGNTDYEPGDSLWGNAEFLHFFFSLDELKAEIRHSGLSILDVHIYGGGIEAGVILKKS